VVVPPIFPVTTLSPACTPELISVVVPFVSPTVTGTNVNFP